jgi:hypothetical protein
MPRSPPLSSMTRGSCSSVLLTADLARRAS